MKPAAMPTSRFACIEEEMADKLNILGMMFDHFGWIAPRDHVAAARSEVLRMLEQKERA